MAAGDTIKGKNLRIKMGTGRIYHATQCDFTTTRAVESMATKDTNGELKTTGNYTWGLSSSAVVAIKPSSGNWQDTKTILDAYVANEPVAVEFTTDVEGDIIISGSCNIIGCNIGAPVNGNATYEVTFDGVGDFVVGVVPAPEIDPEED